MPHRPLCVPSPRTRRLASCGPAPPPVDLLCHGLLLVCADRCQQRRPPSSCSYSSEARHRAPPQVPLLLCVAPLLCFPENLDENLARAPFVPSPRPVSGLSSIASGVLRQVPHRQDRHPYQYTGAVDFVKSFDDRRLVPLRLPCTSTPRPDRQVPRQRVYLYRRSRGRQVPLPTTPNIYENMYHYRRRVPLLPSATREQLLPLPSNPSHSENARFEASVSFRSCEDSFDYVRLSSSWTRSSSLRDFSCRCR
ncbi:hypothetical protein VPH35_079267 [Triticum aestivum]